VLDVLGTEDEWVETPYGLTRLDGVLVPNGDRVRVGDFFAEIDLWRSGSSTFATNSFRLATFVPSPSGAILIALGAAFAARRRR
jgi:hypothetical protein